MAGKTFRGVGDDGEPSSRRPQDDAPRLADEAEDARGLYSGPTVVDDQKVAEVLKKLRSLDQAPGPLTGITEAVDDANPTEPVRIDPRNLKIDTGLRAASPPAPVLRSPPAPAVESAPPPGIKSDPGPARRADIMYPLARPTAVGRSVSESADAQPVTIPAEAGRGTMLGRSIHLRDANTPDAAEVEISSGSVQFLDGSPPTSQPFPLAEPRIAAAAPAAAPKPSVPLPELTSPPIHRFHTPYEPTDTHVIGARRKAARALALVAGLAIVGGGWYAWQRFGGTSGPQTPPQATAPAAPSPPAIEPLPVAPQPAAPSAATAAPTPAPAPEAVPAPVAGTPPAAAAATPKPALEEPARPANRTATSRRSGTAPVRRPATRAVDPADDSAAPAPRKHGRSPRRPAVTEDPDATLPPSD